jgi:hypothetical protein
MYSKEDLEKDIENVKNHVIYGRGIAQKIALQNKLGKICREIESAKDKLKKPDLRQKMRLADKKVNPKTIWKELP